MYIRFVITQMDEESRQPQGLFRAAGALLDSYDLTAVEREELQSMIIWFNRNLPSPDRCDIRGRVTFWFRASAEECVRRMWQMVRILRAHDYFIEVHKCEYLHNCLYWDKYQVAAQPSPQDAKPTIK